MAYDRLGESVRLIDGGPVAGRVRLSRRRRFLPVAVDVDGDVAVTVILKRAHGGAVVDRHLLCRRGGQWNVLGGGGGPADLDLLVHVPAAAELGGPARADWCGGCAVGSTAKLASGARWLSYAVLTTTDDVIGITVVGGRAIARPAHGRIAVVWPGHRNLPVYVNGRDDRVLDTLDLTP